MINYRQELSAQLRELKQLEQEAANRLKNYKGLEKGNIRACTHNGVTQYYFRKAGEDKEHYIPKIEMGKIKLLIQRDYDEKVHKELGEMIKRLDKFNTKYDADSIDDLYNKLPVGRKDLVVPILPTRHMIIDEWYRMHPGGKNSYEMKHEFITLRGEAVRSKSEKMIADYLNALEIPYVCEPEVRLRTGGFAYPDFIMLNVRKSKTYYLEHLGLVDQDRYATKNFNKLIDYEEVGIVLGINLIITMETEERPLDMKAVERKIKKYLL